MRIWIVAALSTVVAAGCSASKSEKCNKFFEKMESSVSSLAGAVGGADGARGAAAFGGDARAKFVELCMSLPDDAVDCLDGSLSNLLDSKCASVLTKMIPAGL